MWPTSASFFGDLYPYACTCGPQDLTLAEVRQLRARQRLFFRDQSYNDLFKARTLRNAYGTRYKRLQDHLASGIVQALIPCRRPNECNRIWCLPVVTSTVLLRRHAHRAPEDLP